jgi:formate dehydrogenase subunit gamma
VADISPKHRGRLILLYDAVGALKCETCFQCAMACPIECIDMGGVDTRQRYHVHWGPPEQYDERREESALRRSGRPVPDATARSFSPIDLDAVTGILGDEDHDPANMLTILARTQDAYGNLPVAALKEISQRTGAWYATIYGASTFYHDLRMEPRSGHTIEVCRCPACSVAGAGRLVRGLERALATRLGLPSPDGAVRLESADCHGTSPGRPYLAVDGEPRPELDEDTAVQLAVQMRAAHAPEARV